jgi:hypothetical protein
MKMTLLTASTQINAIVQGLAKIELMLTVSNYKFGLLYVNKFQNDENSIYSNTSGSSEYDYFLSALGDTVALKGYQGYRGGLDVRFNETGTHSIVAQRKGYGIMFHVCTMLPFQPKDEQKVERKRHVGNDVVVLIFKDKGAQDDVFDPKTLTSHFNSCFFVVSPHFNAAKQFDGFVLNICNKSGIYPYPPFFPNETPFFPKAQTKEFIDFLLLKMINSERTALRWGEFDINVVNTRMVHLQEVLPKKIAKK